MSPRFDSRVDTEAVAVTVSREMKLGSNIILFACREGKGKDEVRIETATESLCVVMFISR